MSDTPETTPRGPLVSAASDRSLMVDVHEGNPDAALALIDRYVSALFNLAFRTTGLAGLAEDVTCGVLASQLRLLAERVPKADRRWIVALAGDLYRRLLAMDLGPDEMTHRIRIPSRHWEAQRLEISSESRLGLRRAAQKLRQRLWQAYSRLSMRQRFVLTLVELHGVSVGELAETIGEPEAVARRIRDEAKLALMAELPRTRKDRRRGRGKERAGRRP